MSGISKIIKPTEVKSTTNRFVCITLRQWALLFSILIFIFMVIITMCTFLGKLHTKQLLDLLGDDIEEERDKHRFDDEDGPMSSNEARLQHSQDIVQNFSKILSICMWLAWINLFVAAVLIYGVATMSILYMFPWILISATTLLLAMTTAVVAYVYPIPGLYISYPVMMVALAGAMVFIEMWYTITLYYLSVARARGCARNPNFSPTIVQAYGGYTHTIQPMRDDPNKPLV